MSGRLIAGTLLLAAGFSLSLIWDRGDPGVRLTADQAASVVGGQTSTHNYKGNGSHNICSGEKYSMCNTAKSCSTTIVPDTLAGRGGLDYIAKQACSKEVCSGLPVSCGSDTIAGCS